MSRAFTPAALVAHADARLAALLAQAAGYRDAALRDAALPPEASRYWPGMIDTLRAQADGLHELGAFAAATGACGAALDIHTAVDRNTERLSDLASQARMAPVRSRASMSCAHADAAPAA